MKTKRIDRPADEAIYSTFTKSALKVINENELDKREIRRAIGLHSDGVFYNKLGGRVSRFTLAEASRLAHELGESLDDMISGSV